MERQFGVIKDLSREYVKIKQRYNEIGEYNSSFNDSSSQGFMNDKGKVNLISKYDKQELLISKYDKQELSNWHLPPKYIELYEYCKDLFKELEIECIVILFI